MKFYVCNFQYMSKPLVFKKAAVLTEKFEEVPSLTAVKDKKSKSFDEEVKPKKEKKSKHVEEPVEEEVKPKKEKKSKHVEEPVEEEVKPKKEKKSKHVEEPVEEEVKPKKEKESKHVEEPVEEEEEVVKPKKEKKSKHVEEPVEEEVKPKKEKKSKHVEEPVEEEISKPKKQKKMNDDSESTGADDSNIIVPAPNLSTPGQYWKRIDDSAYLDKAVVKDNSHWAAKKGGDTWANKAAEDLGKVRGKGFRKEMQKKKRSSWVGGGQLEMNVNSIVYSDSD